MPTVNGQQEIARSMNAIRNIVRALRVNTRSIELKLGISLAQLFVLQQLSDRSADSLNELAERTATHQSSVSVVVRRLVERGFVSRTAAPNDKRRIRIALTPSGETLLRTAPPTVQGDLVAALKRMPTDQRQTLAELLDTWLLTAGVDAGTASLLFEHGLHADN